MRTLNILAVILSSAVLLSACSSVKLDDKAPIAESTGSTPADARSVGTVTTGSADPLNDPQGVLAKRSVYFDLDSNIIKDEYKPIVSAHAKYLSQNRGKQVRIEGNADERGSSEYNLALGQRRADAVKQMMQLLGAPASQIETISFGKEKPKAAGHDEAAWAENRRADIKYQGE